MGIFSAFSEVGYRCFQMGREAALYAWLDDILALNRREHREVVPVYSIVTDLPNNPRKMQLISKYFYCEQVFEESTLDRSKIVYRYRNFFSDGLAHTQSTHGNEQSDSHGEPDDKRGNALEFKPVLTKPGTDAATVDPLDVILGLLAREEEIRHSSASSPPTKSHPRKRYEL